jgi:hypothetical protein
LVNAINWSTLDLLDSLEISSIISTDLGFLSKLPGLTHLEMKHAIEHAGSGGSPLRPPFEGLPRGLTWLRMSDDAPDTLRPQLREYLGLSSGSGMPVVWGPVRRAEQDAEDKDERDCTRYVELRRRSEGRDGETEYEALEAATHRLRVADPELLERLDLENETDGTWIGARSGDDLDAALRILGIE